MDTFEYPAEVVYERTRQAQLLAARIAHIRDICTKAIELDSPRETDGWTDRHWLAQSVLNILDGKIDDELA